MVILRVFGESRRPAAYGGGAQLKVMLLEDDPSLRFALTQILDAGGHCVNAAADISEAVDLLDAFSPDLLLLDLMIGDEYSIQIADLAAYRAPDAKIIYLTGSNKFPSGELFALSPNTSWVLRKPIDFYDLESILEHFARKISCALPN